MPNMMLCPICGNEVMPESDGKEGEIVSCQKCGTDLRVRDKKAFKSFDLPGAGDSEGSEDGPGLGGRVSFL